MRTQRDAHAKVVRAHHLHAHTHEHSARAPAAPPETDLPQRGVRIVCLTGPDRPSRSEPVARRLPAPKARLTCCPLSWHLRHSWQGR